MSSCTTNKKSGSSKKTIRAGTPFSLPKALPITVLLLLLVSSGAAANVPVSDTIPEIKWEAPFNPDNANMPKHYSSGSTLDFRVDLECDILSSSPGDIRWMRKTADSYTFQEVESKQLKDRWDHCNNSADADYSATTYLFQETTNEYSLTEGETKTVLIDGTEFTITATDIQPGSSPSSAVVTIGSTDYDIYEGEYVTVDGVNFRLDESYETTSEYITLTTYDQSDSPADGNYRYRTVVETGNDNYYSDSIYFDVSDLNNDNIPYIDQVTVDGQRVYDFKQYSGISPGATVEVDVIEREGDAYNVVLEDRTVGAFVNDIQRQNVNSDGELEDVYSLVLDFFIDPFVDTAGLKGDNSKRLVYKLTPLERESGAELFDKNGTFDFGFDVNNDGGRLSPNYTITTEDTGFAPNITDVEGSGDCSTYSSLSSFDSYQSLKCIRVTATDDDTEELFVGMNLTEVYDDRDRNRYENLSAHFDERNGDKYIFNLSNIDVPTDTVNASGTWRAEFEASDGIETDTERVTWNVPWGSIQVNMPSPLDGLDLLYNETTSMQLEVTCSGGPECVNQNESLTLYPDPVKSEPFLRGLL